MAIADVSPAYKDAVSAFLKRLEYLMRPHCCGTQRAHSPHIRRVLQAAYTGKIRPGVRAPVAQKADDYWFKLFAGHSVLLLWSKLAECIFVVASEVDQSLTA
jgi:hypothetical protein